MKGAYELEAKAWHISVLDMKACFISFEYPTFQVAQEYVHKRARAKDKISLAAIS